MLGQIAIVVVLLLLGVVTIAIIWLVGLRARSPLVLSVVIRFQRAIANPRQMRSAGTAGASTSVIRHRGRTSGRAYETPVAVVATDDGFVISLQFGSHTNWLRNVLAAGSATIVHEGRAYAVDRPEFIPLQEVASRFAPSYQRQFRLFRVNEGLRVRKADQNEVAHAARMVSEPASNDAAGKPLLSGHGTSDDASSSH
jgi:deazaflavin-dependent oxidoreductase (nitroreductase family)